MKTDTVCAMLSCVITLINDAAVLVDYGFYCTTNCNFVACWGAHMLANYLQFLLPNAIAATDYSRNQLISTNLYFFIRI